MIKPENRFGGSIVLDQHSRDLGTSKEQSFRACVQYFDPLVVFECVV
jgi:hypothetical protein